MTDSAAKPTPENNVGLLALSTVRAFETALYKAINHRCHKPITLTLPEPSLSPAKMIRIINIKISMQVCFCRHQQTASSRFSGKVETFRHPLSANGVEWFLGSPRGDDSRDDNIKVMKLKCKTPNEARENTRAFRQILVCRRRDS